MADDGSPRWVFSFALFPLGLGLFVFGILETLASHRSANWTPTPALVHTSRLARRFPVPPQPDIRYRYEVEGKFYVSNRIWPGDIAAIMPVRRTHSEVLVRLFPENSVVAAFVNPTAPEQSALVPGARRAGGWLIVFSIFLALSLWAPFAVGRRKIPKPGPGRSRKQSREDEP